MQTAKHPAPDHRGAWRDDPRMPLLRSGGDEMTESATLNPSDVAKGIEVAWGAWLARSSRPQTPHPYAYASAYRNCERRMVYEMTAPQTLPPWPPEVLARFRRGDDRERDLLSDLQRIGRDSDPPFTLIGQQEHFKLKDHKGRVAISGKVDARIQIGGVRPPLEVKAWSPMMVDRIETFADLFENPWTRSGAHQLLSYLWGAGEPFGFLLLDRSGIPRLLPVELEPHLDHMEDFLARAERAIDHVEAETLPPFLENDAGECKRCAWYGHTCNPPLASAGAVVLTDPDLHAMLERRALLEASAKEFDKLDKRIKEQLRGIEQGIAGPFVINGRWQKKTGVDLPADVKAKYTKTDPKGQFRIEITRMDAPATPLEVQS
jgi:hypothetical protein